MKSARHDKANSGRLEGAAFRCFLNAELLLVLVIGSSGATTAYAATCPAPTDLRLAHLQGTVYGPSGVTLPQIQVEAVQAGKLVAQAQTDDRGRFQLKVAPGDYDVRLQFLGTKAMEMDVKVARNLGGFFHTARLRIVLGISGAKCSFATTSKKKFKNEMKRYEQRLVEMPPGP
jgi:hypothetical protein